MFQTLFLNTFGASAGEKCGISRKYKVTALFCRHYPPHGNSILPLAPQNTLAETFVRCVPRTYEAVTDTFMQVLDHRTPPPTFSRLHISINSRYTTICKSRDGVGIRVQDKDLLYWICLKIVLTMCLDDFYMYYLMRTLFFYIERSKKQE